MSTTSKPKRGRPAKATQNHAAAYGQAETAAFGSYFVKAKRKVGRPRSKTTTNKNKNKNKKRKKTAGHVSTPLQSPETIDDLAAMVAATAKKVTRRNWSKGVLLQLVDRAVASVVSKSDLWKSKDSRTGFLKRLGIPDTTFRKAMGRHEAGASAPALVTDREAQAVVNLVQASDEAQRPMMRTQVLTALEKITKGKKLTRDQLSNAWHRTILPRAQADKKLTGLVTAQAGTDDRTAAGAEHLQREWHAVIDSALARLRELNTHIPNFSDIEDHFVLNLDEECCMAAGYKTKVYGTQQKTKHDDNRGTSRVSITLVRCGNAANNEGPCFFLLQGKHRRAAYTRKYLEEHGAPVHSDIIMTPSAFMTDEAWAELVPKLVEGIRAMPVIRDHPEAYVLLTLDGFKSHTKAASSILVFHNSKILLVVEHRASSTLNQAFDKHVAKLSKSTCHTAIDELADAGETVDQWRLVTVALGGTARSSNSAVWATSHLAVNMNPRCRVGIDEWLERIPYAVAAARVFSTDEAGVVTLLPAFRRKMAPEKKVHILQLVREHDNQWDMSLVNDLRTAGMKFDEVSHIIKIVVVEEAAAAAPAIAAASSANTAASVTATTTTTTTTTTKTATGSTATATSSPASSATAPAFERYTLHPTNLKGNNAARFAHLVQYRNTFNSVNDATTISSHLDISMTQVQKTVVGPTVFDVNNRDMLQSSCMRDGHGHASHKIAKRTLNQAGILLGKATLLTDGVLVKRIKGVLQLGANIEAIKSTEAAAGKVKAVQQKQSAAEKESIRESKQTEKMEQAAKVLTAVFKKLGVQAVSEIASVAQVEKLKITELDAVYLSVAKKSGKGGSKAVKQLALRLLLHIAAGAAP